MKPVRKPRRSTSTARTGWEAAARRMSAAGDDMLLLQNCLPDEILQEVGRFSKLTGRSRSQIVRQALREYLARHAPADVTKAMDRICKDLGSQSDPFIAAASSRILKRNEW